MIDHIGLKVRDYPKLKAFYQKVLAPLGYELIMELGPEAGLDYQGAGFGAKGKPDFWIGRGEASGPMHVAFLVADRKTVDAFHAAALAAGGKDNGRPGLRAHYHPTYYGAFALDLDGNNIEAVCHKPA